jgi:hypothetical protein
MKPFLKSAGKMKIRNPKHEIRSKHEAQMAKIRKKGCPGHRFEFDSSFGLPRRDPMGTL